MVFKKIDRYIGRSFLTRFFGVVLLLCMLYVVFDLLKRLEEIQQSTAAGVAGAVSSYYAYLLALFLADIMPGLILVSGGMVLVSMARRRELLALKANGTSLYRVMAPIFFWTVLLSIGVFGFRESAGPNLAQKKLLLDRVLENDVEREVLLRDPRHNRKIFIGQYGFARESIRDICLLEFHGPDSTMLKRVIQADRATWNPDGSLTLETVEVRPFNRSAAALEPRFLPTRRIETELSPLKIARAVEDDPEALRLVHSLPELRRLVRSHPTVPHFRVLFHSRLASFFSPFILLLVGLPCLVGFEESIKSRFLSVIISILVAGGFYALGFVFTSMGETQAISPVVAGWLPAILGGAAGLWLFQAMVT